MDIINHGNLPPGFDHVGGTSQLGTLSSNYVAQRYDGAGINTFKYNAGLKQYTHLPGRTMIFGPKGTWGKVLEEKRIIVKQIDGASGTVKQASTPNAYFEKARKIQSLGYIIPNLPRGASVPRIVGMETGEGDNRAYDTNYPWATGMDLSSQQAPAEPGRYDDPGALPKGNLKDAMGSQTDTIALQGGTSGGSSSDQTFFTANDPTDSLRQRLKDYKEKLKSDPSGGDDLEGRLIDTKMPIIPTDLQSASTGSYLTDELSKRIIELKFPNIPDELQDITQNAVISRIIDTAMSPGQLELANNILDLGQFRQPVHYPSLSSSSESSTSVSSGEAVKRVAEGIKNLTISFDLEEYIPEVIRIISEEEQKEPEDVTMDEVEDFVEETKEVLIDLLMSSAPPSRRNSSSEEEGKNWNRDRILKVPASSGSSGGNGSFKEGRPWQRRRSSSGSSIPRPIQRRRSYSPPAPRRSGRQSKSVKKYKASNKNRRYSSSDKSNKGVPSDFSDRNFI